MALLIEQEVAPASAAVGAAMAAYARRGEPVVQSWLAEMAEAPVTDELGFLRCVVAIDRRVVEIVVTPTAALAGLSFAVWRLAGSGWQVVVLSPANRMGEAHAALRGTPCTIQPWWTDDGIVSFGRVEAV